MSAVGANGVGCQVVKLLFVKPLAGKPQLQDGNTGGVVLNDERRSSARRHERNCTWLMEVTSATASPIFAWGWKKTLIMPIPTSDWDSM